MGVVDQLPTLLAVVVGGVLTYLASHLTERSRWRRQLRIRWDERRLDACARFAGTAKRIALLASRMLAARGLITSISPIDPGEGRALLSEAESERSLQFESILLLAEGPTIASAQALTETLWRLERYATGDVPVDEETWRDGFVRYRAARAAFYRQARLGMGVTEAEIPLGFSTSSGELPPASLAATGTD